MSTMHDDQIQIGMQRSVMELLEQAATEVQQSVASFVLQAAAERAEEVLAKRTIVRLSPRGSVALTEALEAPPRPNERLADALSRPRRFTWID